MAQVIVKYASIVLTPEAPDFKGGAWHVEGMKNENIVASAIAYLRCENTTTSRLAFRSMVDEPNYEQGGASSLFLSPSGCVAIFDLGIRRTGGVCQGPGNDFFCGAVMPFG